MVSLEQLDEHGAGGREQPAIPRRPDHQGEGTGRLQRIIMHPGDGHVEGSDPEHPAGRLARVGFLPQQGVNFGGAEWTFVPGTHLDHGDPWFGFFRFGKRLGLIGGEVGNPAGPRARFIGRGVARIGHDQDILETGGEGLAVVAGLRAFQPCNPRQKPRQGLVKLPGIRGRRGPAFLIFGHQFPGSGIRGV